MSLQTAGKLVVKHDTHQVSEKFKKREFVIEIVEEINGKEYSNFAKFQLTQNKCEIIDRFNVGDSLNVSFNIKGNKWERDGKVNYITNLEAWRIEAGASTQNGTKPQEAPKESQQSTYPLNHGIPIYASNHTTNGGSGVPTKEQVAAYAPNFNQTGGIAEDDLPF